MTAVECVKAVRFAVWQVLRIKGLTCWQRLQLAFLKIVAVCGYHYGKYLSYVDTSRAHGFMIPRKQAVQAAVARSACTACATCLYIWVASS